MTHELVIECNNYSGIASRDRCNLIEEYIRQNMKNLCRIKSVKMTEIEVLPNLIQPTLVIRYDNGDHGALVETLDKILLEIGITAIKAVVNEIVTRAVEGALTGGGTGLVAGASSKNAKAALGATLVGALLGGIIGNSIENRILELVSTKEHGRWNHQPYLQKRRS
ncbi:MAG: glycine zipper 2TM domain-containing protein [Rhabdochlamydiaceae bacterium]